MIEKVLPDLVTAISDIVQLVSDQCLAKRLIPESVYRRVLESGGTSEDKARILVLAVKTSTETDSRCFKIFLSILHQQPTCKELVSAIREELTETKLPSTTMHFLSPFGDEDIDLFSTAKRQYDQAPTQNLLLSEMLRASDRLTGKLEALKKQNQQATSDANARIRVTASEQEISALNQRIEELKGTTEKQNRQSSGDLSSKIEELSLQLQREEKANISKAEVSLSQTVQSIPSEELPREYTSLQSSLLGKLEDFIQQHERACAERGSLEEKLKIKSGEYEILKQEFEALKSQAQKAGFHLAAVLPGVDVCAETTVIITNNPQTFIWEKFGLKLHIPKGCLPEDVKQCTINIKASLAGHYKFSKDAILVSGIFWLRCEPRCRFNMPVSIEIEHCAESENTSKLTFVKALCSQKNLPYTFTEIGGQFNEKSSYGILELSSFSGLAVLLRGSRGREYSARLFYLNLTAYMYEIHMVITWNTKLHLAVSVHKHRRRLCHYGCTALQCLIIVHIHMYMYAICTTTCCMQVVQEKYK